MLRIIIVVACLLTGCQATHVAVTIAAPMSRLTDGQIHLTVTR
jgi:hypothetical protein